MRSVLERVLVREKTNLNTKNAKMVENMMVDKSQSEVIENLGRCFASSANFGFKKVHFSLQSGQFFIQITDGCWQKEESAKQGDIYQIKN